MLRKASSGASTCTRLYCKPVVAELRYIGDATRLDQNVSSHVHGKRKSPKATAEESPLALPELRTVSPSRPRCRAVFRTSQGTELTLLMTYGSSTTIPTALPRPDRPTPTPLFIYLRLRMGRWWRQLALIGARSPLTAPPSRASSRPDGPACCAWLLLRAACGCCSSCSSRRTARQETVHRLSSRPAALTCLTPFPCRDRASLRRPSARCLDVRLDETVVAEAGPGIRTASFVPDFSSRSSSFRIFVDDDERASARLTYAPAVNGQDASAELVWAERHLLAVVPQAQVPQPLVQVTR